MNESDILKSQDWSFPIPIAYGLGRLCQIGQHCIAMGVRNPMIVTDRDSKDLRFVSELRRYLTDSNLSTSIFSDISPNPRDNEIGGGRYKFRSGEHDAIIAIGGGSAMDGGKAICLTARNDIHLWDFEWESEPVKISLDQAFPKLITIPTTAGTGAETESTAMVTHTGKSMKFCIYHPQLQPSLALLDPELTVGLPASLTAWTGADALVHAIEAYCVPDFHPLCDGLALEALSLVKKWLSVAVDQPKNMQARAGMLVGSCLAGIAFQKGLGYVHAISHMVGAEFNTQHGLTNAIILPAVLRFNLPGIEYKVERMAHAMGLKNTSVNSFISEIERILDYVSIPSSLSEIGVPEDCVDRIAKKAMQDSAAGTNPRPASMSQMQTLIETAIKKAR